MTPDADMHGSLHAQRVRAHLAGRITAAGGFLPFDEYMRAALYEPGLGYYSAGARKLGAGGDFTTAPEMSAMFGYCLAQQCAEVLGALGGGDILEPGAGSGRLAFDLLTRLAARDALPRRYFILEVSADLRERQRALIATLPPAVAARVVWLDDVPREPWQGVVLANEVLDALPVTCFAWREGAALERGVGLVPDGAADGAFGWRERGAPPAVTAQVAALRSEAGEHWPSGYVSEYCARVAPWVDGITQSMTRGVALFIDYGLARRDYYHPQRTAGTLLCHYRQRAHDDPFAHPGMEDITAWVDFTRVAEAADAAGLAVLGFCTQSALLLGLGIEAEVAAAEDERMLVRRAGEARRLLMPGEMGESFKAMALGRGYDGPLSGFALQDLRGRL